MRTANVKAPAKIVKLYEPHPIGPENILLDTEDNRSLGEGKVRIRALDGFVFIKNNEYVYPRYQDSTPAWWKDVVAYGYIAALTGDFRYFIWAGQWDEDFDGKHIEVVKLENLQGLYKEANTHWHQKEEHILWLETKAGYSYALLEPAEEYDNGDWLRVTNTWTKLPEGQSTADPSFAPALRDEPRPPWWRGKGSDKAWKHFVKPIQDEARRELARKRKKLKAGQEERDRREKAKDTALVTKKLPKAKEKAKRKGKGKGKDKEDEDESEGEKEEETEEETEERGKKKGSASGLSPTKTKVEEARLGGASVGTKRKRESVSETTLKLRPRSKRLSYIEIPSDDDTNKSAEEDEDKESAKKPSPKRARAGPAPKEVDVVMADPPRSAKPRPKPVKKLALPGKDQGQSTALNTQSQSDKGPQVEPEGECTADPPLASQPTRAMQGLTIGEPTDQSKMDAGIVRQNSENNPAAQAPVPTPSHPSPPTVDSDPVRSTPALRHDAPAASTIPALSSASPTAVTLALPTGPSSVVAAVAASPTSPSDPTSSLIPAVSGPGSILISTLASAIPATPVAPAPAPSSVPALAPPAAPPLAPAPAPLQGSALAPAPTPAPSTSAPAPGSSPALVPAPVPAPIPAAALPTSDLAADLASTLPPSPDPSLAPGPAPALALAPPALVPALISAPAPAPAALAPATHVLAAPAPAFPPVNLAPTSSSIEPVSDLDLDNMCSAHRIENLGH